MSKSKNQFTESATARLISFFRSGDEASAAEIRQMFGIKNVSARISDLRTAGYPVYADTRLSYSDELKGVLPTTVYHFGSPTRRQMAAGLLVLRNPTLLKKLGPQIDRNLRLA